MIFLLSIILLATFSLSTFIPYWTRKTESFGVTIPADIYHTDDLKAMRKNYVKVVGVFSIIILGGFIFMNSFIQYSESTLSIIFSVLIFIYIIGSFFIYLTFHKQMKILKQSKNWATERSQLIVIDTAFHNQKLTYSNLWFMIALIISIVTTIMTFQFYDRIPEMIPMNYDLTGTVTNWTEKSYQSVLMFPIMQVFMTALFLFMNVMIAKAKQQISAENPKQSGKQNITFRRRWSAYIIIMGTVLVVMFSFIQFSLMFSLNQQVVLILSLIITFGSIIGAIILSITTGQGGSRVRIKDDNNGQVIDRDDDKYWKFGQFYFNKNDPSIFLEKRFGIGWTCNWAHPVSWLFIVGILVLSIGIPLLLTN